MKIDKRGKYQPIKHILIYACVLLLALSWQGCLQRMPVSESYFALAEGNSWLYEGKEENVPIEVEITIQKPDPSFGLPSEVLDLSVTGTAGAFKLSEEGLFLEVSPGEVKLLGVRKMGSPPVFFRNPYIWLKEPLRTGDEYSTEISGNPTPKKMIVEKTIKERTPWGVKDGFLLKEKTNGSLQTGAQVVFVPYIGFTSLSLPGWFKVRLKDADIR